MNLIELKNVRKYYVNKSFDLKISENSKLLIIGKNGSGKSTLVKLITSYIKPSSGKILKNIKKISYLEEAPLLPMNLNVLEFIKMIAAIKESLINYELLNIFKIPLNKNIKELSKGNKQKLAILITFIGNSDLVILDEPLNGLDEEAIKAFIDFVNHYEKAIIIITHYPKLYQMSLYEVINL